MRSLASFSYREFYDVPRMIVLRRGGSLILLESMFEAGRDEYSDNYRVFVLPDIELQDSWEGLSSKATKFLGEIPICDVKFDSTLRKEIDPELIDRLLHDSSGP